MDDGLAGEEPYDDLVGARIMYGSVAKPARALRSGQLAVTALLMPCIPAL
ncbi:conserved hypothetical protein [Roseovarius sp. EC-HK134]|nr:conserved hypothetical protein [Roseovarius sp. EC-HK134]VVT16759.1 conserved hypothetical protein [Roseovarius sp. EC-SD190]